MKNKLCEETIQYSSTYISYMYCEIPWWKITQTPTGKLRSLSFTCSINYNIVI
jgi:hypothetical protein